MTDRLADVAARIHGVHQLHAVVGAIRGISGARAREARALLAGIDAYAEVVRAAIGQALSLVPDEREVGRRRPGRERLGLVLFGAEQGFAGAFSEHVLDAVSTEIQVGAEILLVGSRAAGLARERGIEIAWSAAMPAHVGTVPQLASQIADELYRRIASGGLTHIEIVSARWTPATGVQVERAALLPVDPGELAGQRRGQTPLVTLPPATLLERLVEEHVYARLCNAAMHAFAAENEARIVAMAAAKTSIERMLGELEGEERRLRQEAITTEIIELASGSGTIGGTPLAAGDRDVSSG